jgi:hypothetical protein
LSVLEDLDEGDEGEGGEDGDEEEDEPEDCDGPFVVDAVSEEAEVAPSLAEPSVAVFSVPAASLSVFLPFAVARLSVL